MLPLWKIWAHPKALSEEKAWNDNGHHLIDGTGGPRRHPRTATRRRFSSSFSRPGMKNMIQPMMFFFDSMWVCRNRLRILDEHFLGGRNVACAVGFSERILFDHVFDDDDSVEVLYLAVWFILLYPVTKLLTLSLWSLVRDTVCTVHSCMISHRV
jgi:hypothetical protein